MSISVDMTRYAEEIKAYEQYPTETGKILLYGSSFLRNWGFDRARHQWNHYGDLDVLNHGFGGAVVEEMLYYYDRMVLPCKPSAVVLRPGHNDLSLGLSPEETWALTEQLIVRLRTDWPKLPIVLLQVFDTKRFHNAKRIALNTKYNQLMLDFATDHPGIYAVDLDPFFQDETGKLRDIFIEDGLHLTDEGYEEVAAWLAPRVRKLLR